MLRYLFVLIALTPLLGCTQVDDGLGQVHGKVTLNGGPFEGVSLSFRPKEGGRPGSGITDAQGNYVVYFTTTAIGAPLGKHDVVVSKMEFKDDDSGVGIELVPKDFRRYTFEVKPDVNNQFDIEMTDAQ
ncbi:hypothetical protein Pan97_28820 [Bremerella volcania]|uniref:Carboxypeptidase regulatory-like domain-containing protein n=1 Tax=Bremerella volcania TaxID=2527984 RepID=A0A518C9E9_9BACT|nr:carboxypeptidase regulatory-like domain-containing protein [Bremerella volcania]QDU75840.1 hypothetical protein Pan97_28820 [Bremerella volcania]